MATTLSLPTIVAQNRDAQPTGVKPSTGSDGTYTWAVVGQRDYRDYSVITVSVNAQADYATTVENTVRGDCKAKENATSYIEVNATFSDRSNTENWTINAGSGNTVRFVRGTGGGGGHK
jgi:hypothetical protein